MTDLEHGQLRFTTKSPTGLIWDIECDTVVSFTDSVNASISQTPIVTYTAENAFTFDTGATATYTFSIMRKNPKSAIDNDSELHGNWSNSHLWSNRLWKIALTKFINRWQAKTDGCRVYYTPYVQESGGYDTQDVYQRRISNVNVYLKSIVFQYSVSSLEVLNVTVNATVGSMCGKQRVVW